MNRIKKILSQLMVIVLLGGAIINVNADNMVTDNFSQLKYPSIAAYGIHQDEVDNSNTDSNELQPRVSTPCYVNGGYGYATFAQYKAAQGHAPDGYHLHHIVEQCQIDKSGFSPYWIHNTSNIVAIPSDIHYQITAHYNNGARATLTGQSFSSQLSYGKKILRQYGY